MGLRIVLLLSRSSTKTLPASLLSQYVLHDPPISVFLSWSLEWGQHETSTRCAQKRQNRWMIHLLVHKVANGP
jgi:hypothetical protein